MRIINLISGENVLVDDEDFDYLSKFTWHRSTKYAVNSKKKIMHRVVMKIDDRKIFIDHIDGNGMNNQKSNLRIATNSQNQLNRQKPDKKNTSGFRGVYWYRNKGYVAGGRWVARIMKDGKRIHIGCFDTKEEAAKAFDKKAKELFGEFCGKLNFE